MAINNRRSKVVARSPEEDFGWALSQYRDLITDGLRSAIGGVPLRQGDREHTGELLKEFYGQIEYHLGWRRYDLSPASYDPGKLLRPTLTLIACDFAASQAGLVQESVRRDLLRRATSAAVAIELVHNFSLIHEDIEDGDEERRYRHTLWKLWGIPQAINSGDGLFALARKGLWQLTDAGFPSQLVL